jgi:hypothetical protein
LGRFLNKTVAIPKPLCYTGVAFMKKEAEKGQKSGVYKLELWKVII